MPSLIKLDMESGLVIELKIFLLYNGIFWTNPYRKKKPSNKLGGGPEINSH